MPSSLPFFGGFWNVIIFNANFKAIPEALFESAKMNEARIEYTISPYCYPVIEASFGY